MKYLGLVMCLLFVGCGVFSRKPAEKLIKREVKVVYTRQQKIIGCVENFLDKDITATASYEMCRDLYTRKR